MPSGRAISNSTWAPLPAPSDEKVVADFIAAHKNDKPAAVVFHNGVFGMFEDARFEGGTRKFIAQLKRMTDAGIKVYVGGGEGGTALEKYGQPDWVTYCFTAGGTVLNALGSEPVPYLVALWTAAQHWAPRRTHSVVWFRHTPCAVLSGRHTECAGYSVPDTVCWARKR